VWQETLAEIEGQVACSKGALFHKGYGWMLPQQFARRKKRACVCAVSQARMPPGDARLPSETQTSCRHKILAMPTARPAPRRPPPRRDARSSGRQGGRAGDVVRSANLRAERNGAARSAPAALRRRVYAGVACCASGSVAAAPAGAAAVPSFRHAAAAMFIQNEPVCVSPG